MKYLTAFHFSSRSQRRAGIRLSQSERLHIIAQPHLLSARRGEASAANATRLHHHPATSPPSSHFCSLFHPPNTSFFLLHLFFLFFYFFTPTFFLSVIGYALLQTAIGCQISVHWRKQVRSHSTRVMCRMQPEIANEIYVTPTLSDMENAGNKHRWKIEKQEIEKIK